MAQEKSNKKVLGKRVTVLLSVICIVLAAGLISTVLLYTSIMTDLQSELADKNDMVSSLNTQVSSLNSQIAALQSEIDQSWTNSKVQELMDSYNAEIADYQVLLSLSKSGYLAQNASVTENASTATSIWSDFLNYAGYVWVQAESNSSTTYVRVSYSLPVTNEVFDYNVTLGTAGEAVLPVLPKVIEIEIGNLELVDAVSSTVTLVYFY